MAETYLTPQDTAAVLKQHVDKCANLGLILSRYTPQEVINNETLPNERHKKYRDGWLREQCQAFEKEVLPSAVSALLRGRLDRWFGMTEGASRFKMRLRSRMMVGLGGKGSLEVGLTLDHVTGLPSIPGSAIKGVVRNYVLLKIAEENNLMFDPGQPEVMNQALVDLEDRIISKDDTSKSAAMFRLAFGTQEAAGGFIFYDAVPTGGMERGLFAADVMTPHFVKYYSTGGGEAAHDRDNPNPVSFVTVDAGVEFAFAIGARKGADLTEDELTWGAGVMIDALETLGIGAKTAAGYGVLTLVE